MNTRQTKLVFFIWVVFFIGITLLMMNKLWDAFEQRDKMVSEYQDNNISRYKDLDRIAQ